MGAGDILIALGLVTLSAIPAVTSFCEYRRAKATADRIDSLGDHRPDGDCFPYTIISTEGEGVYPFGRSVISVSTFAGDVEIPRAVSSLGGATASGADQGSQARTGSFSIKRINEHLIDEALRENLSLVHGKTSAGKDQ